jgi:3-carboxy-cis,cis-muconate cycloisomerase
MTALEAGLRVPGLVATLVGDLAPEHERGLGHWQTNWWTLADLFEAAWSATSAMIEVVEGWRVDTVAMQANIDRIGGFLYAESLTTLLAERIGKPAAQKLVEAVCKEALDAKRPLRDAVVASPELMKQLTATDVERAFDPARQLGSAGAMIDRVLAAWAARGNND